MDKNQKDLPLPQKDLPRPEKELEVPTEPKPVKPISKNKWIVFIIAALAILFATLIGGFLLEEKNAARPVACTAEAKICPDGSSVGRTGPKCEFSKCPDSNNDTLKKNSYENSFYSVEFPEPYFINTYADSDKSIEISDIKDSSSVIKGADSNHIRIDITYSYDEMPTKFKGEMNIQDESVKPYAINGLSGYRMIRGDVTLGSDLVYLKNPNGGYASISLLSYKENKNFETAFEKILSTFKFTDAADTSAWKTYTMPTEKLSLKYPADWTLTPGAKVGTKECGTNGCNTVDSDNVTINGPQGFEMGIGQGNESIDTPYRKGTPCPNPADTCTNYSSEPISIAGKNLYLIISGYKHAGQEQMELGISTYSDCLMFCRAGLGKAKHQPGNIQAFAQYSGKYNLTPSEFMKDSNVKKAEEILKSLSY